MYNLKQNINRINTSSVKYEEMDLKFGKENLLPFWVADMDLKCPDFMIDSLVKRAEHGVFGYTKRMPEYYDSIINWLQNRHGVAVDSMDLEYGPGVVFLLNMMIRLFTKEDEKIIIQSPVYYPFKSIIEGNKRLVSDNSLLEVDGSYYINFEDLCEKVKDPKCTMMILCSPHNPVGRVWRECEIRDIAEMCYNNNVLLVSDEIHFDLVMKEHKHYSVGKLEKKYQENTIICTAPSKTFNIAGLHSAYCIIKNKELMSQYRNELGLLDLNRSNVFSRELTETAYTNGADYVDELVDFIGENMNLVYDFMSEHIRGIKPYKMEATYLMWLDCRALGLSSEALDDLFINKAGLALDSGHWFGENGHGYMRINVACPKSTLKLGLEQLKNAIAELNHNL